MAGETMPSAGTGGVTSTSSMADLMMSTSASFGGQPLAGAGAAAQQQDPPVFLGERYGDTRSSDDTPRGFGSGTRELQFKLKSRQQMLKEFEKKPRKEQRKIALMLTLAGYAGRGSLENAKEDAREMTLGETMAAYADLLEDSSSRFAAGQRITPDQLLSRAIAYRLPNKADWSGKLEDLNTSLSKAGVEVNLDDPEEEAPTSGKEVSTDRRVDFMDPADAKALTRGLLQRELGRDPTQAEFEDFLGAIHAAEAQGAATSRTVTNWQDDGTGNPRTDTNTTTHQGIGAAGIEDQMLEKARQQPGWAEWQAVGTYAPALFEALGATVPGR